MPYEWTPEKRLRMFSARVQELSNLRLVRDGWNLKYTLQWDAVSHMMRIRVSKVDEDDLRSFLLTFRLFVSEKEPVFVNRIFNDCYKYITSDYYKGELVKAREAWKKTLREGAFTLVINGRQITGERLLDLWINGYYFHNDLDKLEELHRLLYPSDWGFVRFKFLDTIASLTQILLFVGAVVTASLRDNLFRFPEK